MSDDQDNERDAVELAAAELVARVKLTHAEQVELPIMDESSVWTVAVKRLSIREEPEK